MRRFGGLLFALLVLLLAGCEPDPLPEIEAEIAALEEKRVAAAEVEKARADADASELALAEAKAKLAEAEARAEQETARRDAVALAVESDAAPPSQTGPKLEALREQTEAAKEAAGRIARDLADAREAARRLRNQAAVLERQLQPGDAAWASERRLRVLGELVVQARDRFASDPVLRGFVEESEARLATDTSPTAIEAGRERAARLKRRLGDVFRLDDPALSALDTPPPVR